MIRVALYITLLFLSTNLYAQDVRILRIQDEHILQYYDLQNGLLPDSTSKTTRTEIPKYYAKTTASAQEVTSKLRGEVTFEYNGNRYDAYIADLSTQDIQLHWKMPYGNPFLNLKNVKHQLESQGKEAVMITNGGMYLKDHSPQGLFVSNGTVIKPLNIGSNSYGNFYMKPNGVFCISGDNAYVLTTEEYQKSSKAKKYTYATQSGPMLVIDGKIHPRFKHRSKNLHLRSGVGILPDGRIVFIISRNTQTNFHDFAVIFKDIFGCDDALYLDGAISRMYLKQLRPNDLGGNFGAIISVTNK